MIRDLAVVEDPVRTRWTGGTTDGAWTFGRLMTAMAGSNDVDAFVRNWLSHWSATQNINGFNVNPRGSLQSLVVAPWPTVNGRLDLTRAPFRLLAIVNRMDLRDLSQGSAGEGRFVFGVVDANGNPLQFTVIFEYRLPATTSAEVTQWAQDWHALGALTVGTAAYNQALENLTNRFAGPNAAPGRINGSALNQLRTNELALAAPWELREFTLAVNGQLVESTVAQTTDLSLNNSATLANYINTNTAALLAGTHVVPTTFNGVNFRGGSALTNFGHFWNAPGITSAEARFRFSVNTCNGCHAGETGTGFLHVFPRNAGAVSSLSGFVTGTTVSDPVSGQARTFNELQGRSASLAEVLCTGAPSTTLTASITPASFFKVVSGTTRATFTATANVTGGNPPYSYQWSLPGGTITSPTASSTSFSVRAIPCEPVDTVLTLTVTDAYGAQAQANADVTVASSGGKVICP
ncbi:MAG: hypothetical protein ACOZQL_02435 [Myxococcota bacterium]